MPGVVPSAGAAATVEVNGQQWSYDAGAVTPDQDREATPEVLAQLQAAGLVSPVQVPPQTEVDNDQATNQNDQDDATGQSTTPADGSVSRRSDSTDYSLGPSGETDGRAYQAAVRLRDDGIEIDESVTREIHASLAGVLDGSKPVYHDHWGAEAAPMADSIRAALSAGGNLDGLTVVARDGHLHVINDRAVAAAAEQMEAHPLQPGESMVDYVHRMAEEATNGRLLGYGSNMEPGRTVNVTLLSPNGDALFGFHADPATAA